MVDGRDVDAGGLRRHDDVLERDGRVDQDVGHRVLDVPKVDSKADRQVGLRVHVDAQDAETLLGQRAGEVDCGSRLADAALLVCDCDDFGQRDRPPPCVASANLARKRLAAHSLVIHRIAKLFTEFCGHLRDRC